jgi:hypothetical protein
MLNNEFVRIYEEAVMAYFKILSWHLDGETEKNCIKPYLEQLVASSRFIPGTSQMQLLPH